MFSAQDISAYAEIVELTMYHQYTREPSNADPDDLDNWNMEILDWGPAVEDQPCNYFAEGQLSARDHTITSVDVPTLSVKKTDPIKIYDRITNIKDAAGTVVHTGPLYVEAKVPAMGFGIVTNYIVQLRGTAPQRW